MGHIGLWLTPGLREWIAGPGESVSQHGPAPARFVHTRTLTHTLEALTPLLHLQEARLSRAWAGAFLLQPHWHPGSQHTEEATLAAAIRPGLCETRAADTHMLTALSDQSQGRLSARLSVLGTSKDIVSPCHSSSCLILPATQGKQLGKPKRTQSQNRCSAPSGPSRRRGGCPGGSVSADGF